MDGDTEKTSIGWALERTVRPNSSLGRITTGNFPIDENGLDTLPLHEPARANAGNDAELGLTWPVVLNDARLNLEGTRDEAQACRFLLAQRDGDCPSAGNARGRVAYAVLANRTSGGSNLLQLFILLQQPVLVVR